MITLTAKQAEKIQDYLRDYVGVIDGLLYDRYGSYDERMALQDDIDRHIALLDPAESEECDEDRGYQVG